MRVPIPVSLSADEHSGNARAPREHETQVTNLAAAREFLAAGGVRWSHLQTTRRRQKCNTHECSRMPGDTILICTCTYGEHNYCGCAMCFMWLSVLTSECHQSHWP